MDEASTAIRNLHAEEEDKGATSFGNYEEAKSRITIDLKTTFVVGKKNKIVKKLKEIFGEEREEGEEDEDEDEEYDKPSQAPLALTQGQGEDQEEEEVEHDEGVEGEEANDAYKPIEKKNKKSKDPTQQN